MSDDLSAQAKPNRVNTSPRLGADLCHRLSDELLSSRAAADILAAHDRRQSPPCLANPADDKQASATAVSESQRQGMHARQGRPRKSTAADACQSAIESERPSPFTVKTTEYSKSASTVADLVNERR